MSWLKLGGLCKTTLRQLHVVRNLTTSTNLALSGCGRDACSSLVVSARTLVSTPSQPSAKSKYNWGHLKAFLFDIDGTLTDTDPLHLKVFAHFFEIGRSKHHVSELFFKESISGRSNHDVVRDFLPHLSAQEETQWILDKEAYFRTLAATKIRPIEGLNELVAYAKHRNVKCAAVTNAPRETAVMILKGLGLMDEDSTNVGGSKDSFDLLVIGNECAHSKPHPEPYLTAMRTLDVEPQCCVALEDSVAGASASVAAGVHTIGILTSQTEDVLREKAGVNQTIHNYYELLQEIKDSSL